MKVIMLGWELPPHNSDGLGVACYGLCQALANDGAMLEFVLPYTAPNQCDFMKIRAALPVNVRRVTATGNSYESFKYHHIGGKTSYHDLFGHQAAYEEAIANLTFDDDFDIIHAHDWLTFRAALKLKQIYDKPVVLHVHSLESDRAGGISGNSLVHAIERLGLESADKIIAVSAHTKQKIIHDYGISEDKIEVSHNSISPDSHSPSLDDENCYKVILALKKQGYTVLVNAGRLTIQKGLTNLLRAFARASDHNPKLLLLLAGSGEQRDELIELAAELGVSRNVFFTNFVRGNTLRDTYSIGDLFIMPSISEPFGLTPLESILHGTPAMVSNQSGVAEVIANVLKVDYWDIDKMVSQIINISQYPNLQSALQDNGLYEVRRMGWHTASEKVFEIYGQLMPATRATQ